MQFKRWNIRPTQKLLATELAEECGVDSFVALIAAGRGYTEPEILEEFLTDEVILADPYELKDIEIAAEVINDAVYAEEKIAVFGDYDVDGVTATALMYSYLKSRNARVTYYIPDREKDGYGISMQAIDKMKSDNIDLIITVDNGISAYDEVNYAKSLGMKVVVTDHHLPPAEIPLADAVVDPHRPDDYSEFKDICGVFVAFKVVCAVEGKCPEELLYDYGDLVALGTLADVMPLVFENRVAVREGLNLIANGSRRGLSALLRAAGIEEYQLTSTRAAFGIAPRLNAAGRMGDAARAAELLLTDDDETAFGLAELLNNENIRRQTYEKQILSEAVNMVEKNGYKHDRVIVVAGNNWHCGVIGIVAAKICEKYGKPTVVLSLCDGVANGSARSIKGFSIYEAIKSCDYILTKFGGHEMAAGITLYENSVDTFRRIINEYAAENDRVMPELWLDCKLNPVALSVELAEEIKTLEPFGTGNPVPVFGIFEVRLDKISPVGQGKHLRLGFSKGDTTFSAMMFGMSKNAFAYDVGDKVDLAVTLDVNIYNNMPSLTVSVKDVRLSGVNDEKLAKDIDLYESFKAGEDKDFSAILPEIAEAREVYKTISGGCSLDRLVCKNLLSVGYAKAMIVAEALCQLKICSFFDVEGVPVIKITNSGVKVNLNDAPILRKLRGEFCDT